MQMTLETLGQLERRLHVAVPVEQIESEVQKRLARLAKTVKIAGFRPGKVPLKMIAQQYGPQVRSDVISDTVQSSFNDAVRAQNLRVAGYPRIEPKQAAASDQFEFSAVFEIYPEVRLGDLSGTKISRPIAEVTSADVDRTIEILRKQRVAYAAVSRPAQPGDRVRVDFTGRIDGVAFPGGEAKDFAIVLGEGRMLPEFDAALAGMSAGESKRFTLTFPADYHGKEVAGKSAEFELKLHSVSEPRLPVVDSEFAKNFGIASGSLDELRAEIEGNLRLELKRKIEAVLKGQVLRALRARTQITVPRSLVEIEAQTLLNRAAAELKRRGVNPEDAKLSLENFAPQAEERVALGLILNEIVRAHDLQAKPEQVRALVAETAQSYEQPEAVIRWHYEKPERLNEFELVAMEHNVVEWMLGNAQVEDAPTSFATLMEPAA
ncbi:MAG TPA: trigger factor [Casimicrobiaceae bacterium]|nr:trigger factor [Casimicrobiaceae bacterium]